MIPSAQSDFLVKRTQALVEEVDITATAMEAKWGVDRLRRLVPLDLRERWDRQCRAWHEAIWTKPIHEIEALSQAMIRGYRALDAAATAAGAPPIEPHAMEVARSDGQVIAIVCDNAQAHAAYHCGRYIEVWTLAELARVIEAFPEIAKAKEVLRGELVDVRGVAQSVPIDWATGDDVSEFI